MRKLLVFITLIMALCFISANAQSYQVEKAFKVKVGDKKATIGMSLTEKDIINVDNNGYLIFVDVKSKKRYYVNHPCRSKVANLVKKAQSPMKVTKSFLDAILTAPRTNTDYASAGSIYRGEEDELKPIEFDVPMANADSLGMKDIPESIEVDPNLIEGETITLYFVIP